MNFDVLILVQSIVFFRWFFQRLCTLVFQTCLLLRVRAQHPISLVSEWVINISVVCGSHRVSVAELTASLVGLSYLILHRTTVSCGLPALAKTRLYLVPSLSWVFKAFLVNFVIVQRFEIYEFYSVISVRVIPNNWLQFTWLNADQLPHNPNFNVLSWILRDWQVTWGVVLFVWHQNMAD